MSERPPFRDPRISCGSRRSSLWMPSLYSIGVAWATHHPKQYITAPIRRASLPDGAKIAGFDKPVYARSEDAYRGWVEFCRREGGNDRLSMGRTARYLAPRTLAPAFIRSPWTAPNPLPFRVLRFRLIPSLPRCSCLSKCRPNDCVTHRSPGSLDLDG
jgi:hypothetical protein